jgi:hypothetical protein
VTAAIPSSAAASRSSRVRAAPSSVSFSFSAEASPCVKHIVAGPDCRGYLREMIMHREADVRAFAAAADIEA